MNHGIENAKITSTVLGYEGHGIFTCVLGLEMNGTGISFGDYGLDEWSEDKKKRIDTKGTGLEFIKEIMRTVGVDKWEDLRNKFVRVDIEGLGGRALGIGHIMEDKWFYPKQWFEERR